MLLILGVWKIVNQISNNRYSCIVKQATIELQSLLVTHPVLHTFHNSLCCEAAFEHSVSFHQ